MSGKGDTPRPKSVPESEYEDNWTRTFCPPLRDPIEDPRETMRRKHLAEAKAVIDAAPVTQRHTDA
jgi:hypothetical protein